MIILSIGTNIGNRKANIENAITALNEIGTVTAVSPIYSSDPWGFESENGFYNIALIIETSLPPLDLLKETQRIEKELGRSAKTTTTYADRIIDIDIIDYDNQIIIYEKEEKKHNPSVFDTSPKTGEEYIRHQSSEQYTKANKPQYCPPVLGGREHCSEGVNNSSFLTLPHPLMHTRNFVFYPLVDLAPEWKHPILKLTAQELKEKSEDKSIPQKRG